MALTTDDLSRDQLEMYTVAFDWAKRRQSKLLTLGGLAGTGKSTVLSLFVAARPVKTMAVVTFTGKASGVIKKKLEAAGVELTTNLRTRNRESEGASLPRSGGPVYTGTIHSLIYIPILDAHDNVTGYKLRTKLDRDYDLLVIDEASMVSPDILWVLREFGVPILAVGDHGQLPPVMSDGGLMEKPDLVLSKIHRQAKDNPIIHLAHAVRNSGELDEDLADDKHIFFEGKDRRQEVLHEKYKGLMPSDLPEYATIVGTNKARITANAMIRKARRRRGLFSGEQVICLRNQKPIFNGMRGILTSDARPFDPVQPWNHAALVGFPDEGIAPAPVSMFIPQFNRERTYAGLEEIQWDGHNIQSMGLVGGFFDYGYALTCHKAQGSGFRDVTVIVSGLGWMDEATRRRWLYTAVTRSSDRVTLLV